MVETSSPPGSSTAGNPPFMERLDDGERSALRELGVTRRFPRGSVLMFQGEPDARVMILLSGRVKVTRIDHSGHELMLSIRDRGDVLGELALIDGEPRSATIAALDPLEALVMPSGAFRRHLETTPRVAVVLLGVVASRFRESTLKRLQFTSLDTMGRVAARIAELADRYGSPCERGIAIASPLSQEELAAWAGASRAGVAQALQSLRELGWLQTARRELVVLDMDALRERAE